MRRRRLLGIVVVILVALGVAPAVAWAQGSIGGMVSDETSGVLPGVTVEASSPALIGGARVGVTDTRVASTS